MRASVERRAINDVLKKCRRWRSICPIHKTVTYRSEHRIKMKKEPMELGMIGLGRMEPNMVRRLRRAGHQCVIYDIHPEP